MNVMGEIGSRYIILDKLSYAINCDNGPRYKASDYVMKQFGFNG